MRIGAAGIVIVVASLASAPALQAQMPGPTRFVSWRPEALGLPVLATGADSTTTKGSGSGMVLGGIGGTLIGWMAGALVGNALTQDQGEEEWDGAVYGAMVGATVAVPVGVHFGNHGHGSLLNELLVSAAIGVAGIAVTSATNSWIPVVLTPLAQVISTIAIEDHAVHKVVPRDASQ